MAYTSYYIFSIGMIFNSINNSGGTCTLPSYMTGTWYDNKFIEIEFSSGTVMFMNQYSITRSGSTTNLTCHISSGKKYVMRTSDTISATISGVPGNYYYFLCMEVTKITDYSFYHYMQSDEDTNGERTFAMIDSDDVISISDICTTTTAAELFQIMVRAGFENDALQLCSEPFLGNFSFILYDTLNTESTGNLNSCSGSKTTINMTYSTGASNTLKVGFSDGGYIGCMANIKSGSQYFTSWYNFDSSTTLTVNPRFTCLIVKYNGTSVTASQRVRMCHEGQESTSKPSDTTPLYPSYTQTAGGLLTLTPYEA
ncbi:uncharacterized protein LOC127726817 [Mytilus californianus]|uniref:uncharacterized protein LOC127726817 n=1 Tax=Mytilus californianus TaxID=6549 RepID=UPI00224716AA|nr:uncharacterized protein LOC127726817 [Mytilus californianus]